MKRNAKKNKGFGIYLVIGIWSLFLLGFIYTPKKPKQTIKELSPVIKIETLYVEKVIPQNIDTNNVKKPIEKKVVTDEINEYAYAGRSYGYDIRKLNNHELRNYLEKNKFRNLKNANLFKMRRIWMAYHYDDMFMNVHLLTDFPVSMIYSFFIIEATNKGIETNLWRIHANAGGGKAIKGYGTVTYKTREVIKGKSKIIRDKFYTAKTTQEGIEAWAKIFNSGRYYDCKKANYKLPKKDLYESICKCVYESGYHTDPKYKFRAQFMAEYWEIKTKNFPIEEF
jgi:hypothetical protein